MRSLPFTNQETNLYVQAVCVHTNMMNKAGVRTVRAGEQGFHAVAIYLAAL